MKIDVEIKLLLMLSDSSGYHWNLSASERKAARFRAWRSYKTTVKYIVESTLYDWTMKKFTRKGDIVTLTLTPNNTLGEDWEDDLISTYGDAAADTWMEGDIQLTPFIELNLGLISFRSVGKGTNRQVTSVETLMSRHRETTDPGRFKRMFSVKSKKKKKKTTKKKTQKKTSRKKRR
jgi:hypothetical protein